MPATADLSLLEQVILARLRTNTSITKAELMCSIASVVDESTMTRARVDATIAGLRAQQLIGKRGLRKTERGNHALRASLGLRRAPSLNQLLQLLAARALAVPPSSEAATRIFETGETLAIAILRRRCVLPAGHSVREVGDALIAERLGLGAGTVTLTRIRQHLLAQRLRGMPDDPLAAAAKAVCAPRSDKRSLIGALAREAMTGTARVTKPSAHDGDPSLLSAVHDAIADVGPDGRVGPEKVFVSAIWQRIAGDHRVADLSLDSFKRWLVHANRDQLLSLARADAVGGMDPRLVAESEIESLGASFHFVVDARHDGAYL